MKFRPGDELLSMSVIKASDDEDPVARYVFTVTDGGYAKRTKVSEYRRQGRGGSGIKAMRLVDDRGSLVGAMVVTDADEVMAVRASGQVTRSLAVEVPAKGRDTMGVRFVLVGGSDSVVAIARNTEREVDAVLLDDGDTPDESQPVAEIRADQAVDDMSTDNAITTQPAEDQPE
jgi:DNA gyrase subunit A